MTRRVSERLESETSGIGQTSEHEGTKQDSSRKVKASSEPERQPSSLISSRYASIDDITFSLQAFNIAQAHGTLSAVTGNKLPQYRFPALAISPSDPPLRGSSLYSGAGSAESAGAGMCAYHDSFMQRAFRERVCAEWCDGWPVALADGYIWWDHRNSRRRTSCRGPAPSPSTGHRQRVFSRSASGKGHARAEHDAIFSHAQLDALTRLVRERWTYLKTYVSRHPEIRSRGIQSDASKMIEYLYDHTGNTAGQRPFAPAGKVRIRRIQTVNTKASAMVTGATRSRRRPSEADKALPQQSNDAERHIAGADDDVAMSHEQDRARGTGSTAASCNTPPGALAGSEYWATFLGRCIFHRSFPSSATPAMRKCPPWCHGSPNTIVDSLLCLTDACGWTFNDGAPDGLFEADLERYVRVADPGMQLTVGNMKYRLRQRWAELEALSAESEELARAGVRHEAGDVLRYLYTHPGQVSEGSYSD